MKKQDSNPSPVDNPDDEIEFRVDRDLMGILPNREWNCLTLDVADILAPRLGAKGIELYYWISQYEEAAHVNYVSQLTAVIQGMARDKMAMPITTGAISEMIAFEKIKAKILTTRFK